MPFQKTFDFINDTKDGLFAKGNETIYIILRKA